MAAVIAVLMLSLYLEAAPANAQIAYASGYNVVHVIDTATDKLTATLNEERFNGVNASVAVSPNGQNVYVGNITKQRVYVIDPTTLKVTRTVSADAQALATSQDGKFVYVAESGEHDIAVIDTSTNFVSTTIPLKGPPADVTVRSDSQRVYASVDGEPSNVSVIDAATNKASNTFDFGLRPEGLAAGPFLGQVWIAINSSNYVARLDSSNNSVLSSIVVGNAPLAVAASADGQSFYVTKETAGRGFTGTVDVIDPPVLSVAKR